MFVKSVALSGCLALAAFACLGSTARADETRPIHIVSALYGRVQDSRPLDFSQRLQQTCGSSASYCEAFCSKAVVGAHSRLHAPFGAPPVCRVVYRCGEEETKATDAWDNETMILSCRTAP